MVIRRVAFVVPQEPHPKSTTILKEFQLSLYLGRVEVDYWFVPIIIGKTER
jgi:hypothetical protein